MKIAELFGGAEQDSAVELLQKMLEFREEVYADCRGNAAASKAASIAAFALFGAFYKYNACCILYFCELAYRDLPVPHEAKWKKMVLCPKCQEEIKNP